MKNKIQRFLRPTGWPLAWQLLGIFWVVAFLPTLAAMTYLYTEAKAAHGDMQTEALQDGAARIANQLSQLIGDVSRMNAFLAMDPSLSRLLASPSQEGLEQVQAMLHRAVVANRDIEPIMVMDRNGNVVTSTDPDLVGRNFAFRDYFKLAVQGRPHVTGFIVGAVAGKTGVFFSHPITAGDGRVVGTFVTKVLAKAFTAIVEAERKSNAQSAFLLDPDGVVVYHPNTDWIYRSLMPLPEKTQADIAADQRFRLPRVDSLNVPSLHEAVTTYRSGGSVNWLSPKTNQIERAGYMPVPGYRWTVVMSSPEYYLALAQVRFEHIMIAVAAAAIIAFGLAFVLLQLTLFKPLVNIYGAAQRIARGEYRDAEKVRAAGQLGDIAGALNIAATELQQRQREQELYGRVLVPEIREKLLPRRSDGNAVARLAVVYCAISGIEEMFDRRSANEVLAALSDYSEQISEIVKPWGGRINYVGGQAILAVFAAPLADGNLESHAVSAALAIQRRVAEFNRTRLEANEPIAEVAIGVCTAGILVTGAASAHERYLNAMLNDGINVSGTLAELSMRAHGHPLMVNHTTYVGVRNRGDITPTSLGPQKLRGRAELSEVYSIVFGVQPPLAPAQVVAIGSKIDKANKSENPRSS